MYHNIMVPVDGSSFSREAVIQGLRIASQSGATFRLVRVASAPMLTGAADFITVEHASERELRNAELADLYAIAAECRAHSTVNVTASLQHGPIVDALIGYARRYRVDLIVMRSHGRKGLARAWFGSVADKLIRESGIPVLVVRPPSVATALGSSFKFKRILVPLDGSELAESSLRSILPLARVDSSQITLLRVVAPSIPAECGDLQSAIGPASACEVAEAERYLDGILGNHDDRSINVRRRVVVSNNVVASILQCADVDESDLIAIATRGQGTLKRARSGSVSDTLMREASISAMVIHPADVRAQNTAGEVATVSPALAV